MRGVLDLGFFFVRDFVVFAFFEVTDHIVDDIGREKFNLRVKLLRAGVVEAAGSLDFVFNVLELELELLKVGASLELRISFGDGKNLREGAFKRALGFGSSLHGVCAHDGRAGFRDILKSGLFMLGVAFDGFDNIRDEVGTIFELDRDIGPGFIDTLIELNEAVVSSPDHRDQQDDDDDNNN